MTKFRTPLFTNIQNVCERFFKLFIATYFLSVNARAQPVLEITESGPLDFCQGDSVTLCANVCSAGCTSPFTFEWLLNDTVLIDSSQCITVKDSGAYCVLLTCSSGCKKIKCRRVNVASPPVAGFDYFPVNPCFTDSVNFANTSTPASGATYSWNFGDAASGAQNTSASQNGIHLFSSPGSFTVNLTVTNSCGQSSYSQTVNISPSGLGYNANCCSEDPTLFNPGNYAVRNDVTISNASDFNAFIAQFQNNTIIIKGLLTFEGVETYTISGKTIQFGIHGKMVAARSVIVNASNCTFTGLDPCNTMWQGIEVWGDASKMPGSSEHGQFIITNSIIRRAHIGILAGRRGVSTFITNHGGGTVDATNCVFFQNGVGVRTNPYPFTNSCRIKNCSFTGAVLPDPLYNASLCGSNCYPNSSNPFNPRATANGQPPYLAYNWGSYKVPYTGNTFQQAETGIENYEGSVWATDNGGTGNTFTNLVYGFTSLGQTNSPLSPLLIFGNTFTNISGVGIRIWGGQLNNISRNQFLNPIGNPQSNFPTGIYLENSGGFYITDNKPYLNLLNGIQVNNSGNMGGIITDLNDHEAGNVFTKCNTSTMTWQQNPALQINCNNYNNPDASLYSRNWLSFGKLANQGNPGTATTDPAGNKFDPNFVGTPKKEIQYFNLCFSVWPNPPCPWNGYNYYRHFSHPVCAQCIKPTPVGQVFVNSPASSLVYVPNQSCDICFACQNLQYLADAKNQIQSLQSDLITLSANLDKGNTQALLNAINSNLSNGLLKDSLINNSPLSDTSLIAFIQKAIDENLAPGIIKQVLQPNLPVSAQVYGWLELLFPAIPQNYKDEIAELQINNPSGNSITSVLEEMESVYNERQVAFNGLALRWIEEEKEDSLLYLLQLENTFETNSLLFGYYLSQSDLSAASSTLSGMFASTPEEQEWGDLQTMLLQLAQNGQNVLDISASQELYLRALAAQLPETPATTAAKSILRFVFGDDFPIAPPSMPSLRKEGLADNNSRFQQPKKEITAIKVSAAFPDPFSTFINIQCYVPTGSGRAELVIYSALGNEVAKFVLAEGQQALKIESAHWNGGLYFYAIVSEKGITERQKMVKLPK